MAITLQRLNVVKVVESEEKAKALVSKGFVRVDELEANEKTSVTIQIDGNTLAEVTKKSGKKAEGGE